MSDRVEPALSEEEWAAQWVKSELGPIVARGEGRGAGNCISVRNGRILAEDESGITTEGVPVSDYAHAMAALCLYGQPFGFGWEDVDQLLSSAADIEDEWPTEEEAQEEGRALRGIAARIAALLPPRRKA